MAKPTVFSWATVPTSPIIYPASAFEVGGYPAGYQIPSAEYNATLNRLGEWITYIDPYIGGIAGDLFANKVRPYGTSEQDGLYLSGVGTYGAELRSFSTRGVRLLTAGGSLVLDSTGLLTASTLAGIQWGSTLPPQYNLAAGLTSSTKLRYAYAATKPTFRLDFSPVNGGFIVALHNWQLDLEQSAAGEAVLAKGTAGAADVAAYCPLQLPHDTARTTETVYEAVSLTVEAKTANAANYARIRLMKRDRATHVASAVLTASTTSTSFASVTDDNGGTPIVLDPASYSYYLSIESANSTNVDFATFRTATLNLRKSAVE